VGDGDLNRVCVISSEVARKIIKKDALDAPSVEIQSANFAPGGTVTDVEPGCMLQIIMQREWTEHTNCVTVM
jgi:hypothetical protein